MYCKTYNKVVILILVNILCLYQSCITEYTQEGVEAPENILVVDGTITNNETIIELSWGIGLNEDFRHMEVIDNAILSVECDNGTIYANTNYIGEGKYSIETGDLHADNKYRLKIILNGEEYNSSYLAPFMTPEIDSISWSKKGEGQPVWITVSTHDPADQSRYYRWQYNEIWEFKSELFANYGKLDGVTMPFDLLSHNNTYYCWERDSSKIFILDSSEKLAENIVSQKKLTEIEPSDEKISLLYYISVKQYQIRKEAYTYYSNLQKNVEQTGSIFSPMPAEIRGNITCESEPGRLVVGYIEVSVCCIKEQFLPELTEKAYEPEPKQCVLFITEDHTMPGYAVYFYDPMIPPTLYAPIKCVNCTTRGTKNKPDFWPTESM